MMPRLERVRNHRSKDSEDGRKYIQNTPLRVGVTWQKTDDRRTLISLLHMKTWVNKADTNRKQNQKPEQKTFVKPEFLDQEKRDNFDVGSYKKSV